MSIVLDTFEAYQNKKTTFWELFPQIKFVTGFKVLYDNDKTKNKKKSSEIVWAIALLADPDTVFDSIPLHQRREQIAKNFLKDEKFDWPRYEHLVVEYENLVMTPAQKDLKGWERNLLKRRMFLDEQEYSLDEFDEDANGKRILIKGTLDQLDKAHALTAKIYADLEKIKKDLKNEDGVKKKNRIDSLVDNEIDF